MPTIEFVAYSEETVKYFKPVLASTVQPDWWKKMKIMEITRGHRQHTVRACPAMDDWLRIGYYLIAAQDIEVINGVSDTDEGDERFSTADISGNGINSISHPASQMGNVFEFVGDGGPIKDAFKMRNPWNVITPKGYSCFYLDPFLHQNKYFSTWPGIIDTDSFNINQDNAQIIFYPKVEKGFIIPKGTPLVQIIPFRREEWVASYQLRSHKAYIENLSSRTSPHGDVPNRLSMSEHRRRDPEGDAFSIGPYRKYGYWHRKDQFFKKMEEGKCPFHTEEESPEKQMEFDF